MSEPISSPSAIQETTARGVCALSIERPTSAEIELLLNRFPFEPRDLQFLLDRDQPTAVVRRAHYDLITLQVHTLTMSRDRSVLTASTVSIFVGQDFVATVHAGNVRTLVRFFRQIETDETLRESVFGGGVNGLLYAVLERALDTVTASQARLERAIVQYEEYLTASEMPSESIVHSITRDRKEARMAYQLAHPLPGLIRSVSGVGSAQTRSNGDDWERLASRSERLLRVFDDDVNALDGMMLSITAIAQIRETSSVRSLTTVAILTLPVLVVTGLFGMALTNPLASQSDGFAIALAIAGGVFLVALALMRRRNAI